MMYPLVTELAAGGIPVAVTLGVPPAVAKRAGERVLKLARQPYYRWLKQPVTQAEWDEAHRVASRGVV
jgi:hypothetical protein